MTHTTPSTPGAPVEVTVADQGYFGPDSVSWTLFSDPSSKLGGVVAVLLQALNPMMMRLFAETSGYATDMAGRAERTGRYIDTTIFGDRAHADAAGTSVSRMHAHARWTDPATGQELRADNHDWLVWTHNTVVWGVLRAADGFGPELSVEQQDRFIMEQHKAAEFVGIDPKVLSRTRAELDAYMDAQKSWMALTLPAAEISKELRKPNLKGHPIKVWAGVIIQDGVLFLLPDWARSLYGIEGRPMNLGSAARLTRRFVSGARTKTSRAELIGEITERVSTHPYRKVRQR